MTIEMVILVNTKNTQKLAVVATLKDICFNILSKNQQWKDNNSWSYLHIITALFKICDLPYHCIKDIIKCYIYQSEYATRSDNWSECTILFGKAIHLVLFMSADQKSDEIAYLCYLIIDTGAGMSKSALKSSVKVITWVFEALEKVLQCKGSASLPKYLYNPLFDLIVNVCQKDTHILRPDVLKGVLETFEKAFHQEKKAGVQYYQAKIQLLLKAVSSVSDPLQTALQTEYFKMVENIVIIADELNILVLITRKLNQNSYISISSLMDGLDLLIHRAENNLIGTSVDSSTLYLCKIYILSDLVVENSRLLAQSNDALIRSAMDAIFLIKEDLQEVDLSAIQIILWRTGDFFYSKYCYGEALSWYHYAYSATQSTFQGTDNAIILAKKLAFCHITNNDPHSAFQCMKKCHENPSNWSTEDFILLLQ
ncbi:hypothetical protein BD408DRAFT_42855 [Parasitella parasitica]|nr:hypothetical protein BD408DRAFT_42855 [Parasitella parasitica]